MQIYGKRARRAFVSVVSVVTVVGGTLLGVATPAFAATTVTFSTSGLAGGVSVALTGTFINQSGASKDLATSSASPFPSPGPSNAQGMKDGSQLTFAFPASLF